MFGISSDKVEEHSSNLTMSQPPIRTRGLENFASLACLDAKASIVSPKNNASGATIPASH